MAINNKSIYTALVGLILLGNVHASATNNCTQPPREGKPSREQIIQHKRAFLKKELALSEQTLEVLMTKLNELDEQRFRLWQELKPISKRLREQDSSLTEAELNQYTERLLNNKVREAELERTYYLQCKELLTAEQWARLDGVNRRFAQEFFGHRQRKGTELSKEQSCQTSKKKDR